MSPIAGLLLTAALGNCLTASPGATADNATMTQKGRNPLATEPPVSGPALPITQCRSPVARADEAPRAPGQEREPMASTTRGVDKSGYHLFNPTPHRLMRPLAGDRPDVTETPFTVDAGHLLVETGLVNYRQDDEGGKESEALSVLNQTNLRLGLLNSTELQMIASIYSNQETEFPRAGTQRLEGFSDLTFRLKQNLWGNDTGRVAVAAKPFLKVPTGTELSNNAFEGGFTMIAGTALGKLGRLTSQIQPRWVFDEAEENHDTELGHTVSWSLNLVGDLGGYLEYVGTVNTDSDTDYQATFSTGLIQNLSKDVALDLGTRLGMTEAAQDLVVFTGMITRF